MGMSEPERAYLATHGAAKHARTAVSVAWCMHVHDRGCTGDGCDEDQPCWRHKNVVRIVERYHRMKARL